MKLLAGHAYFDTYVNNANTTEVNPRLMIHEPLVSLKYSSYI